MGLTLDVISHYAFGGPFRLPGKLGFYSGWKYTILAMIEASIMNCQLPW